MRKIVSNFFISLDGVVEAPEKWHFPYFDDAMGAAVASGTSTTSAFLMGRKLYDEWAGYWPSRETPPAGEPEDEAAEFAAFINGIDKYVVSDSLDSASWSNTTVLRGDEAAARLAELKAQDGGDISMSGSAVLVRWLLAQGLLDELRLLVHPIAVGEGKRLFEDTRQPLKLVSSETFDTGVLNLTYLPA